MTVSSNNDDQVNDGVADEGTNSDDVEKGSDGTHETEPQTDVERRVSTSVSFSLPPPELRQEAPRESPIQRRGAQIEVSHDESQSRRTSYRTKSGATQGGSKRLSSLEMRRLPVDVLLRPDISDSSSVLSDDFEPENKEKETVGAEHGLLHYLCLRPGYSLKTQLLSSFGSISAITIITVVVTCILVAHSSGENVKDTSIDAFREIAETTQGLTARYLAELLSEKFILTDTVNLLHEAVLDRVSGYPSVSDDQVPFRDAITGRNIYPIDFPPPPLEWELEANVNADNYEEHFRGQDYFRTRPVSTASASFLMKGVCDPDETDPEGLAYWPNCTDANNDIATGGVVAPSNMTEVVYNKGKDLIPLLKSIHESRGVIRDTGVYFANDGAGATVNYPHYRLSTGSTYTSTGCEWMETPNFYDPSRPIGTPEMIEKCSPKEEEVSSRIYNPMERVWCVDQALNPDRIRFDSGRDAWDNTSWLLTMGRAVYDRITNEFVSCLYVGISLGLVDEELRRAVVVEGERIALVNLDDQGTVVGSSVQTNRSQEESLSIDKAGFGFSETDYKRVSKLVDFDEVWDPVDVRRKYEEFVYEGSEFFITASPLPPVPKAYDETYEPVFLILVATPNEYVFSAARAAKEVVDDSVRSVTVFSIAAGAIGLIIALFTIYAMADVLTRPLHKMNKVASEIVSNFGDPTKENAIGTDGEPVSTKSSCTPRTELSEVVAEFNKMVASFSGSSMVKTQRHKSHEVYNMYALHRNFTELYRRRFEPGFKYVLGEPTVQTEKDDDTEEESITYVHSGTNMIDDHETFTTSPSTLKRAKVSTVKSPLFLWIVALIVIPLLVVNIIITAVSLSKVSRKFGDSVDLAEKDFFEVQESKLSVHSRLRAELAAGLTTRATHDLHVMTRYANWLLFDGVTTADTFTEMISGIEECKSYSDALQCPFVQDNSLCDCAWKDDRTGTCSVVPDGSRELQDIFWICQSDTAGPDGDRTSNSYPDVANSPDSTEWWSDQLSVPGFNSSQEDSNFDNTYRRLKTAASNPLFQPMYNYHEVKEDTLAMYIAYEADGLFVGYDGCTTGFHVDLVGFVSTVENEAASLRPELCPLGKFGYDPRCRRWYDDGRQLALDEARYLHVTAPYEFVTGGQRIEFAQSATSPLIDPETGEHLGQVLLDFLPARMVRSISEETVLGDGGFPFLVSADFDSEFDTVIGPGYFPEDEPISITDLILKYDKLCDSDRCKSNVDAFVEVIKEMKNGSIGNATLYRVDENEKVETLLLSFAPVTVPSFRPVDSSDFSRGLEASEYTIYSLALVESENGILEAFEPIRDVTDQQVARAIGILSTLLIFATILIVFISLRLTESIAEPMVYLLEIIRSIRKCDDVKKDLRNVKSSTEVIAFSDSIEMLSQVVSSANTAFYAGEFERAYFVLVDALRLFRRLDNKKAIGIACNNLGNVMMGLYQEMTKENEKKLAGLTKKQIIMKGIAYFHEAIQLGEKAYDEFYNLHGWTPPCLDFMQHLSNRYFNRGLFLLSVKNDHEKPDDLEELGKRDLQIASDMDSEVIAYGEEIGWDTYDRMEKIFEVKIARLGGYNLLLESGYEDTWDVDELADEAFDIIRKESKKGSSNLFERVTVAGRLQEVETELMKYYQLKGNLETAARIAVRCLHEDEKVFVDAEARAIAVISQYTDEQADMSASTRSWLKNTLEDYSDMLLDAIRHQTQTSLNEMESEILTKATGGSGKDSKRFSSANWSMQQSSGRFVTMEDF